MNRIIASSLFTASLFLSACSLLAPPPTPTATATNTPLPTDAPEPTATFTPEPTNTPIPPTDTPESQNNDPGLTETPVAEWLGIPVMPEAIAASSGSVAYFYSVDASLEDIFEFYEREMAALGYPYLGYTETTSGSTIFSFALEDRPVSITVAPQDDGTNLVLIF